MLRSLRKGRPASAVRQKVRKRGKERGKMRWREQWKLNIRDTSSYISLCVFICSLKSHTIPVIPTISHSPASLPSTQSYIDSLHIACDLYNGIRVFPVYVRYMHIYGGASDGNIIGQSPPYPSLLNYTSLEKCCLLLCICTF